MERYYATLLKKSQLHDATQKSCFCGQPKETNTKLVSMSRTHTCLHIHNIIQNISTC